MKDLVTMKDLVIQGPAMSPAALDTFKVVCMPERITVSGRAARCVAVRSDAETRKAVRGLGEYSKLDHAFVDPQLRLADFRLLALDMDSTLINIETLDEVAALAGKGEEVAAITSAAMRGELDYRQSLRQRVALLKGADAALLARVYNEKLMFNDGAQALVDACHAAGLKVLLATGGLSPDLTVFLDIEPQHGLARRTSILRAWQRWLTETYCALLMPVSLIPPFVQDHDLNEAGSAEIGRVQQPV